MRCIHGKEKGSIDKERHVAKIEQLQACQRLLDGILFRFGSDCRPPLARLHPNENAAVAVQLCSALLSGWMDGWIPEEACRTWDSEVGPRGSDGGCPRAEQSSQVNGWLAYCACEASWWPCLWPTLVSRSSRHPACPASSIAHRFPDSLVKNPRVWVGKPWLEHGSPVSCGASDR